MKTLDGHDIKCLLGKKGHSFTSIGRDLGVTPQAVSQVVWGKDTSQRIMEHIERLLGVKSGTLQMVHRTRTPSRRVA